MKSYEVKIIPLEETSQQQFDPYGQIMGREEGQPYETLEILKYWSGNADLGPEGEKVDGGLLT
jgi:hypothetical protein